MFIYETVVVPRIPRCSPLKAVALRGYYQILPSACRGILPWILSTLASARVSARIASDG